MGWGRGVVWVGLGRVSRVSKGRGGVWRGVVGCGVVWWGRVG